MHSAARRVFQSSKSASSQATRMQRVQDHVRAGILLAGTHENPLSRWAMPEGEATDDLGRYLGAWYGRKISDDLGRCFEAWYERKSCGRIFRPPRVRLFYCAILLFKSSEVKVEWIRCTKFVFALNLRLLRSSLHSCPCPSVMTLAIYNVFAIHW